MLASGPRRRRTLAGALLVAVAAGRAAGAAGDGESRRFTGLWSFGFLAGDEIGRGVSATGGEELTARLPDGPVVGLRLRRELGRVAVGLDWTLPLLPIEVENEEGSELPDHGAQLAFVSLVVELHPLRTTRRSFSPFLAAGGGGALVAVDLDNQGGQELTLRAQWSLGVGVRWRRRTGSDRRFELRCELLGMRGRRPGGEVRLRTVTFGYGFTI